MTRLLQPNVPKKLANFVGQKQIQKWSDCGFEVQGVYEISKRNKRSSHIQAKLDRWVQGCK